MLSPFKTKEYELCLLSSLAYEEEEEDQFDLKALAEELAQPFTFQKVCLSSFLLFLIVRAHDNFKYCSSLKIVFSRTMKHIIVAELM
jgi:hypothetical protein